MGDFRAQNEPDGLWFYGGPTTWFYINDENADLLSYAINLVSAVDSKDMFSFYKIMRDGMRDHPLGSTIYDDSYTVLRYFPMFMDKEILQKIWKDPAFPTTIKWEFYKKYSRQFGENLIIEPASIIIIR